MSQGRVAVVLGSDSDLDAMRGCFDTLDKLGIPREAHVISAHRTPDDAHEFAKGAREAGLSVIIAAAGGAAHLAGVLASMTTLPVIGVPLASSVLGGADALHSTVQMPPGVPVATVSVGSWGGTNAAVLAAEVLALSDGALSKRLDEYRDDMVAKVRKKAERLREKLGTPRGDSGGT